LRRGSRWPERGGWACPRCAGRWSSRIHNSRTDSRPVRDARRARSTSARERVSPSWRTGAGMPLLRAAIRGAPSAAGTPQQSAPIRRMPRPLALSQVAGRSEEARRGAPGHTRHIGRLITTRGTCASQPWFARGHRAHPTKHTKRRWLRTESPAIVRSAHIYQGVNHVLRDYSLLPGRDEGAV